LGLGPYFGLGKGQGSVERGAAMVTFASLVVLIVLVLVT